MMKRYYLCFLALIIIHIASNFVTAQNNNSHYKIDKIVLDAGHGGYDPGASGLNSEEKNITLSIALLAGNMIIDELPGIEVLYTRTDDSFVKLNDRAKFANEQEADLFISIHCNSNTSSTPFGTETYVMGLHKSEENLEVAKTENAAILMEEDYKEQYDGFDPNMDEDYIMLNMFQIANIEQSLEFSQILQDQMLSNAKMYDRGVKQAGFVVLYLTTMPGVLLETGFLSNPGEEKFLLKKSNQEKIARAIVEAIRIYRQESDLKLEALVLAKSRNDIEDETSPEKVFRIGFASLKKQKFAGDKMFKGMTDVWNYYENGRYHYTFGEASSLIQAKDIYHKVVSDGEIKWKYLKSAKIVVSEGDKVVSTMEAFE
jgi:N-acetylmuramoyl-L-alanine amidase